MAMHDIDFPAPDGTRHTDVRNEIEQPGKANGFPRDLSA